MKKIIFFFLTTFSLTLQAQTTYRVSGKIINAATKQPMQGASVFADNTTIGTASSDDGNFTLQLPHGGYDLIVTFTGFEVATKRITTANAGDNNIIIELKQKEKELGDVVVKTSYEVKDGWEKYGEFFFDNFIGKTVNSKQCSILNKEVLKFYYYKRSNRLKILATAPLEIANEALGYTIQYTLDSFIHEYNTQISLYTGYPLFKEKTPADAEKKNEWSNNRVIAYNGSILHFMRSLYHKQLQKEGFEIQFLVKNNAAENAIPIKDFYGALNYSRDDSSQTVDILPNQTEAAIIYKKESPHQWYLASVDEAPATFQLSMLSFLPATPLTIEQNGYYFEQNDITITGYWGWEKVGDMLPYDFIIN